MSNSWTPVKRSPVHHKLEQLGAVLEPISQWQCAGHFGDPGREAEAASSGVGLLDFSFTGKWELKGKDLGKFLESNLDQPTPEPGTVILTDLGCLARITRNHSLLVTQRKDDPVLVGLTDTQSHSDCIHAIDRSNGLGQFLLCGPQAGQLLGKLTSLDLREASFPNLRCACTPLAATLATVVRWDRNSLPGYQIVFNSEYGEYLWDCVMEAGEEFHIGPFGLAALRLLES